MVETVASTPVLSFPAILRNPGLKDRYAHLRAGTSAHPVDGSPDQIRVKKVRRDQNEGKRWVRRKDNAHFVHNPHMVAATKNDYTLPTPTNKQTFPEPLPAYLPRTAKVPVAAIPARDPVSANAGRFSLSMKGMRKDLRRAGGKAEAIVREVEIEMMEWLQGGVILRPDESNAAGLADLQITRDEGRQIGSTGIVEVSRSPLQLVWSIADDAFARYVVHCCARYHEVVSFSKGDSNDRLTYLLRPNVRKPDYRMTSSLDTPPITDLDSSSQIETTDVDSDFVSDRDFGDSDAEEATSSSRLVPADSGGNLDPITETSLPSSPRQPIEDNLLREDDEWSVLSGDAEAFGDVESSSEAGQDLLDSIASLTLEDGSFHPSRPVDGEPLEEDDLRDPDTTLTQGAVDLIQEALHEAPSPVRLPHHQQPPRLLGRRWERSSSSPSRSPVRARRLTAAKKKRHASNMRAARGATLNTSFYDYLFN